MSRALQINSSPQGWMARNTKPVPLAEKGWVITMKKISIILLSAVLVFSMAACNGGKEKADNQTEKQTESVKPTEEAEMATEAVTEVTTEAGSEETDKDIAEVKDSEEKIDKEDNRSADNETDSKQEQKPKQNDEPEQKAPVNDNEEAGGNQSNAGKGGGKMINCYTLAKKFNPYLDMWRNHRLNKYGDSEWLFPDAKNPSEHIQISTINSWSNTFSRLSGKPAYIHSLRHYFTTSLAKAGIPDGVIQSIVAWESSDMVQIYKDIDADEQIGMYFKDGDIVVPEKKGLEDL